MTKIAVLDAATLGRDIDLSPLRALGDTVIYQNTAANEVAERLADAEVAVVNKIKMNAEALSNATRLRLICVTATGYDNVDTALCRARGIALCNVPAYCTDSVAQLTLSMAISLATHLFSYRAYVASGSYTASGVANHLVPPFRELSSLTFGVVGGGAIGTRVAELAAAFGCRVLVCRRQKAGAFPCVDMDTLCREADILSLHVPLTEATRGMLSRARIQMMKKGAIVINTARGAVVDEAALADAVLSGHLGGVGVDVFSTEPFGTDSPYARIKSLPNVCLTPHMAWGAVEARARCVQAVAENIAAFFSGNAQNRII